MYELMANFKYCIIKDLKEVIENKRDRVLSIDCQTWGCVVAVGIAVFHHSHCPVHPLHWQRMRWCGAIIAGPEWNTGWLIGKLLFAGSILLKVKLLDIIISNNQSFILLQNHAFKPHPPACPREFAVCSWAYNSKSLQKEGKVGKVCQAQAVFWASQAETGLWGLAPKPYKDIAACPAPWQGSEVLGMWFSSFTKA